MEMVDDETEGSINEDMDEPTVESEDELVEESVEEIVENAEEQAIPTEEDAIEQETEETIAETNGDVSDLEDPDEELLEGSEEEVSDNSEDTNDDEIGDEEPPNEDIHRDHELSYDEVAPPEVEPDKKTNGKGLGTALILIGIVLGVPLFFMISAGIGIPFLVAIVMLAVILVGAGGWLIVRSGKK